MSYEYKEYYTALYRLEYIGEVKVRLKQCLLALAGYERSKMQVASYELARADAEIDDMVDDLFYEHAALSRHVRSSVERDNWRKAVRDWQP